MSCVGGKRRKESEWRSEEVVVTVAGKLRAFKDWLQRIDGITWNIPGTTSGV